MEMVPIGPWATKTSFVGSTRLCSPCESQCYCLQLSVTKSLCELLRLFCVQVRYKTFILLTLSVAKYVGGVRHSHVITAGTKGRIKKFQVSCVSQSVILAS